MHKNILLCIGSFLINFYYLFFLIKTIPTVASIVDNANITSFDAAVPVLVKILPIVVLLEVVPLLLSFVVTVLSSSLLSSTIVNLVKWFVSNSNLDDPLLNIPPSTFSQAFFFSL